MQLNQSFMLYICLSIKMSIFPDCFQTVATINQCYINYIIKIFRVAHNGGGGTGGGWQMLMVTAN